MIRKQPNEKKPYINIYKDLFGKKLRIFLNDGAIVEGVFYMFEPYYVDDDEDEDGDYSIDNKYYIDLDTLRYIKETKAYNYPVSVLNEKDIIDIVVL